MKNKFTYQVELPKYEGEGLELPWMDDAKIYVKSDQSTNTATLIANVGGLKTLAHIMLILAQDGVQGGRDLHFAEDTGLEEESSELLIVRMAEQDEL